MKNVLVLCTGNSCRSQIAHGYLEYFAPKGTHVFSAGVEIHGVNPKAIATMKADGIDISAYTSNNIDEYNDQLFDYIITVCDNAKERCPYFPSDAVKFHQNFPDPPKFKGTDEEIAGEFQRVREMIKVYCKEFVSAYL
ncbi:MAG: arsenate reductase [Crocinitomicaceae bacterium]|jgi:arsenate reductase